ncbi:MAG TPA: hypothetical protein VNN80_28645 [Polyangiaceae bacterium]|jgi:hypothetical protein|nr:hypothetical protein [Polyangiaceae bacterium]
MTTGAIWTRLPRWFSCAALVAVPLAPSAAAAEEPTLEQVEYHPAELPPDGARTRAILVGVALTAGWYGAAVGTSYLWPDAPNSRDLRLPVVGPWLALGDVGCADAESDCSTGTVITRTVLTVLSGVGQAGGLFGVFEGLFMETGSTAPAPASADRGSGRGAAGPIASWSASPVMLRDGAGLELFGRF